MKKFIMALVASSCLTLSLSGCPTTGVGGIGGGLGGGTSTGTGDIFASKQAFINFYTCLSNKVTDPSEKASIQSLMTIFNSVPDSTWTIYFSSVPQAQKDALNVYLSNALAASCK